MMRRLHNIGLNKGYMNETLLDKESMLEKLPLLYSKYKMAIEIVNTIVEHAEFKSKELQTLRQRHEIDRGEFRNTMKVLKHKMDNADILRYQCFVIYIARFFDGSEDELASIMQSNGYVLHSSLYIQPGIKVIYSSFIDILFD